MRKITCDICNKDISDYFMDDHEALEDYSGKIMDLCDYCEEKYFSIRSECGRKYHELMKKRDREIRKEMEKFMNKELEKLKSEEEVD